MANTRLLLHLNGEDGATSTIDSSPSGHSISFYGNAQLDTAEKKFGISSLLLDGSLDYLTIPDSPDWDICGSASDNWTIDLWVKHSIYDNDVAYCGQYEDANNRWTFGYNGASNAHVLYFKSNGVGIILTPPGGIISDTNWHHVALCKVGSKYAIYLDGVQVNYLDDSSIDTLAGDLYIGRNPIGAYDFNGHMDEIRITHDNAFNASPNSEKTDTIIVPTSEYEIRKQISSDAHVKISDIQKQINSDAEIIPVGREYRLISSDAHIKVTGLEKDITSDAWIFGDDIQKYITSDANISGVKLLTSDAKIISGKIFGADIRARKYPTINIQLLEYVDNVDITLRMTVDGAVQMRFKNEGAPDWSAWEDFDQEKSWTLLAGEGVKKIFAQFKDSDDTFSDGDEYFECVLDQTNPSSITVQCRKDFGDTVIIDNSWISYPNVLFFWEPEENISSVLGYSIAIDTDPNNQIDVLQNTVVIAGMIPSKKPATDRTIEITAGKFYISTEQYENIASEVELETNVGQANPRIDSVYYDYLFRELKFIKGENNPSPIAPVLPDSALPIAEVTFAANANSFTDIDINDIRSFHIAYDNFLIEKLAVGSHIFKVKSQSKAGLWSNISTFNINVCDLNPDIQGLRVYETSSKLIEFFSDVIQYESPNCYVEWQDPGSQGGNTYYYTTDGSDPDLGSSNTANTFINLNLGEGTYIIKVRAKENHCDILGKIYTFIFKYSSEDFSPEKIVVVID